MWYRRHNGANRLSLKSPVKGGMSPVHFGDIGWACQGSERGGQLGKENKVFSKLRPGGLIESEGASKGGLSDGMLGRIISRLKLRKGGRKQWFYSDVIIFVMIGGACKDIPRIRGLTLPYEASSLPRAPPPPR